MASRIAAGLALLLLQLVACSAPIRPYSTKPIVWKDDDERPFEKKPEVYLSPLIWNGTDHLIFLPMSNALSVKTGKESVDVNAVDEVPDSAWFTNRLSVGTMTPEEMARGSCRGESPELERPWTVTGAKFDGQTPGFTIRTKSGARYLLKFDDAKQPERASAADVIGSKIYYAAGFTAPCNRVVFFDAADMVVPEKADAGSGGKQVTREYVDQLLGLVPRAPDGKLRAMATELLEGQPLGPWKYEGVRADDPNDIIPHEDRREVRATRVLGAWLNHYDHGENNTLDMWIRVPAGGGYVKHDTLDWGDALGFLWDQDEISRRLGYSYYFDFGTTGRDFVTLGVVERPWDRAHLGKAGATLGYFNDEDFDPEEWHPGYPNTAFSRMTERDGAWMTRIVARFSNADIEAMVAEGKLTDPVVRQELVRILEGRRDRILQRWLSQLSSLTDVTLRAAGAGPELCVRDRAEEAGWPPAPAPSARLWSSRRGGPEKLTVNRTEGSLCIPLPDGSGDYLVVDIVSGRPNQHPLRVHLRGDLPALAVVGVERPNSDSDPGRLPPMGGGP
ncbi:MAG TPA: hypothetical protein VK454_14005 [Myxococcaceae bacterium]|nr:hypothetical protein [Myxococcaceae bacterium]